MQIICSRVDGIKVQLCEAITRYRTRISENGLRGRIEMGCSCENRFVSKRWYPSFNVCVKCVSALSAKYCWYGVLKWGIVLKPTANDKYHMFF